MYTKYTLIPRTIPMWKELLELSKSIRKPRQDWTAARDGDS
jgi:hypothetical protein